VACVGPIRPPGVGKLKVGELLLLCSFFTELTGGVASYVARLPTPCTDVTEWTTEGEPE
jgi:hypothetical protein